MYKDVLVPLTGGSADRSALVAAHALLRESGGHIRALYVHDDTAAIANTIQADAMGVPVVTPDLITALNEEAIAAKRRAKQGFDTLCKQEGIAKEARPDAAIVCGSWQEAKGDVVNTIAAESCYSDVIVMAREGDFAEPSPHDIGSIVTSSGRPLILMPPKWQPRASLRVAIAWKEKPEAARAVTAALPLLEDAKDVSIFCVTENHDREDAKISGNRCATYLTRHGIYNESTEIDGDKTDVASVLFSEAKRAGVGLLVLGAYGHSRLREFVFGGVTRAALFEAPIPVLLMH